MALLQRFFQLPHCVDLNSLATVFFNSGIGELDARLTLAVYVAFLWSASRAEPGGPGESPKANGEAICVSALHAACASFQAPAWEAECLNPDLTFQSEGASSFQCTWSNEKSRSAPYPPFCGPGVAVFRARFVAHQCTRVPFAPAMNCRCLAPFVNHRPPLQLRLRDPGTGYSISTRLRRQPPAHPNPIAFASTIRGLKNRR